MSTMRRALVEGGVSTVQSEASAIVNAAESQAPVLVTNAADTLTGTLTGHTDSISDTVNTATNHTADVINTVTSGAAATTNNVAGTLVSHTDNAGTVLADTVNTATTDATHTTNDLLTVAAQGANTLDSGAQSTASVITQAASSMQTHADSLLGNTTQSGGTDNTVIPTASNDASSIVHGTVDQTSGMNGLDGVVDHASAVSGSLQDGGASASHAAATGSSWLGAIDGTSHDGSGTGSVGGPLTGGVDVHALHAVATTIHHGLLG